jgi:hypothetical protein
MAVAALAAAAPVAAVCAVNFQHYGWFGTVEVRSPEFLGAYGALARVRVEPPMDYVPVTRATRLAVYPVSPAFAELRPYLEGDIGHEWGGPDRRINAGMWMWALRESVVASGHGRNASDALAFYRRIGEEVNHACDSGVLPAGPRHDWMLPVWSGTVSARFREQFLPYLLHFALFEGFNARPQRSNGTIQELELFRDLTQWHLSPNDRTPELMTPDARAFRAWRVGALQEIGSDVRWVCVGLVIAGAVSWLFVAARALSARRMPGYPWWLSSAALGSSLAVFGVSLLVNISAWPDWRPLRFSEAYPLLILFAAAALASIPKTRSMKP